MHYRDDTCGHTHLQADGVDVPAAGSTAGGDQHLVILPVGDQRFQYRRYGFDATVANGLAANLHYLDIGIKAFLGGDVRFVYKFVADQTLFGNKS